MTKWLRGIAGSLVVCAGVAAPFSADADSEAQRHTLVGLTGVHLQVDLRGEDLEKFGLVETEVRPEVESKLAAAGLQLLDVEASRRTPGVPWLFVEAIVVRSQDAKEYAWAVRVQLQQRACLERDPKICESLGSWEGYRLGSVGRRRVRTLRQDVLDVIDQFIVAYLAANAGG
jgi:hypothetical protein